MESQDKQAEINHSRGEFQLGSWEDSKPQQQARKKQLELAMPNIPRGQLVLDAGCGPGTYGVILSEWGNNVVGIDISSDAVREAGKRALNNCLAFVPMVGDIENLPFREASFDICFCGYALHHFPNINKAVIEFTRVLKPGGTLVLAEPNGSNPVVILNNGIKNLFRGWLAETALDTPNEVIHKIKTYTNILEQQGYEQVKIFSCFCGGLPPLPKSRGMGSLDLATLNMIKTLVHLRQLIFIISNKTLPRPLNGADLFVIGAKAEKAVVN
jgi:ubiquinone/menaquinone biosynthesis C-methylase UbiE